MAHVLWSRYLAFDSADPLWPNRDRFILSAGHGSMLQYALLHLAGYDLSLDELTRFRQLHSKTPGHPENHLTPGVEMATGPLGQGVAHSVGFAIAERFLAATYNRPDFPLFDHFTYVICSDGDLMEGAAQEAASLAGHLKLGKLIWLYDDNGITIDGPTHLAFSEDVGRRFEALGWHVQEIDGMDMAAVDTALAEARAHSSAPSLIKARTVIGFGSPKLAGTNKAHSNPFGPDELSATKRILGLPEEPFFIDSAVQEFYNDVRDSGIERHRAWTELWNRYESQFPEESEQIRRASEHGYKIDWASVLPNITEAMATRKASEHTIQALAPHFPTLLGGSADLAESNLTTQKGYGEFSAGNYAGKTINFGVREFGMAAAVNGINLHGITRGFGASFMVFSDYARPAIRLAALMETPSIYVFTHDSVGVGEDGPTHQPVEHLTALRAIPNLNVFRPADGNETAVGWMLALQSASTPTFLALTRQAVPTLTPAPGPDHPATRGGYVLKAVSDPRAIIIATGSEVGVAVEAQRQLGEEGIAVNVVSLPSWWLFDRQPDEYRASVLPKGLPTVSVEAGSTLAWPRYADRSVGIDRFGLSAPGGKVMVELGITAEHVASAVKDLLAAG